MAIDRNTEDMITIGPLGSGIDKLLFWRSSQRVMTLRADAEWEGSLDDFAEWVELTCRNRQLPQSIRVGREYRAAVVFLQAISSEGISQ